MGCVGVGLATSGSGLGEVGTQWVVFAWGWYQMGRVCGGIGTKGIMLEWDKLCHGTGKEWIVCEWGWHSASCV